MEAASNKSCYQKRLKTKAGKQSGLNPKLLYEVA